MEGEPKMTAKEWLGVMQKAADYNPKMTTLIEKYGEMLVSEEVDKRVEERLREELIKFIEWEGDNEFPIHVPIESIVKKYLKQRQP